ncbi:MAG: ABC transporter permease [Isosphaeraceae bacterium]|nr:ABC transporter permease [Isosphaeraceae bacterium]
MNSSTPPREVDDRSATTPRAPGPGARRLVEIVRAPETGLFIGILVILGAIYFLEPRHSFFSIYSIRTLVHNTALFGVLALGAAVVIIAGGIDLSIGAVVALSAVVTAKLLTEWLPGLPAKAGDPIAPHLVAVAVFAALALGLAIGLLHALMINVFRLPPFIATLATMAGLRSVAILVSGNRSINVVSPTFRLLGSDNRYTVPIFLAVAVAASVMMGWTVLGRRLYALGGNETAARLSGLPTRRLKMIAYGLSGMLAALGGVLFAGNTGQAQGTMGVSYELYAITAAVVGGCGLSGGIGSIRGTVLGLILIQIVIKGTGNVIRGVDSTQLEGLVLGTVVVLAVAFNERFRKRS